MKQKITKIISTLLVTTILYANSAAVISYAADNFLSADELEKQETSIKNTNVEFDVYYDGGTHTNSIDINSTDTKLNIKLNVKDTGYLKDITVDFADSNFVISDDGTNSDKVQTFDAENKKITFNQINGGSEVVKSLNILANKSDEVSANMFNKDNNINLTATYVDKDAKENQITKSIVIHTGWKVEDATALLNYEITKYIPYAVNGTNKVIVQGKLTSGVENSILPIEETNIELIAPQINNEYPESVTVIANSTLATNGNTSEATYTFDETTGKIAINAKNDASDGKIYWTKNTLDEYLITYIYSSNVYTAVKDQTVRITYEATSILSLYNDGTGIDKVKRSINGYEEKTEKLGEVIDFKAEGTKELYKGYMYNNKIATDENKKETEYQVKYTANIPYVDIIDGIRLSLKEDLFITPRETAEPIKVINNAYIKTLKISKNEFDKILGANGTITITDAEGKTLTSITAETSAEKGYITLDLTSFAKTSLVVQTSKPQIAGNITFELTKAINKNLQYDESEIKSFAQMLTETSINAIQGSATLLSETLTTTTQLKEPTQKASVTTNKDTLSTILTNEDVEIKVTLENDSIDDVMYNSPTITIKLPSNIENINIKEIVPYFDDELSIEKYDLIDNTDGTKSIVIKLKGNQTKYNNVAAKGATIVVTADVTLNKLTPTTDRTIEVDVENGNTNKTTVSAKTHIKYVAPAGIVTTNSISGYNDESEELIVINGEPKTATIKTNVDAKEVTYKMNVINNYANTLDNIIVLGRTSFAGNKDIITAENLGSNMSIPLSSEITVNNIDATKVTIYYSENGEATTDLSLAANNWITTVEDYSKVKSYMIVLNDYTMNTGDAFDFGYTATIPASLDYDQSSYENYAIFFNNNQASGTIQDKTSAVKIGLTTGTIARLEATLTSEIPEGETVKGGTKLKYTLKVNNVGTEGAEDVVASTLIPNSVTYVPGENDSYNIEYDENGNTILKLNLGTIASLANIEKVITLQPAVTALLEPEIAIQATVTASKDISLTTNKVIHKLAKTYFTTQVDTSVQDSNYMMEGNTHVYELLAKSSDSYSMETNEKITRENTIITVTLPEELEYDSIELLQYSSELKDYEDISSTATVTTNGKTVTVNIGSLDGNRGKTLKVKSKIGRLPEGAYQKEATITATIQADNTDIEKISDVTDTLNKPGLKLTQNCNIPEGTVITAGEEFTYTFTIENLSETILQNVVLTDYLPQGVKFKSAKISYADGSVSTSKNVDENGKPEVEMNIKPKEVLTIEITVKAESLETDTKITNKASISNEYVSAVESNQFTHTIKKFVNTDIEIDPGTGEEKETKKIIGTIWLDANKDGVKDVSEEKVSGATVLLLDNATGDIAKDANGNTAITRTAKDGTYMFNYLNEGRYTVIFIYDSANYSATTYQKANVDEAKNSDAIDKNIVYQGVSTIGAVTEEISISEENKYDIDLGLVENQKFDLKLDKVVNSITVNNTKGTEKHEYNKNFAKVEFDSKYVESATMIIEYKFTITNEGAIPGYVKKIADYLPQGLKFSTELNTDWYEGKDGTIYNAALANTLIHPGESKEVTLILTKNMTKESFDLITNTAEIYEASNDYGIEDMDSIPGNKTTNEDDISIANVLPSVKTGETVIYTLLTITVIAILGVGIFLIKKKVIK